MGGWLRRLLPGRCAVERSEDRGRQELVASEGRRHRGELLQELRQRRLSRVLVAIRRRRTHAIAAAVIVGIAADAAAASRRLGEEACEGWGAVADSLAPRRVAPEELPQAVARHVSECARVDEAYLFWVHRNRWVGRWVGK